MMISKFYLKQKILGVNDLLWGGKLGGGFGEPPRYGRYIGGGGVEMGGSLGTMCQTIYIYKRVLFT